MSNSVTINTVIQLSWKLTKKSEKIIYFRYPTQVARMATVDSVPKDLRQLRACLVCSLIKSFDQFERDGCDNCESVLTLRRNRDNVYDCTSANFEGMIASCKPEDSWVCRWSCKLVSWLGGCRSVLKLSTC